MSKLDPVTRGRLQLFLIGLLFIGPVILAWLIYGGRIEWQPESGTQHGELIEPVVMLPDFAPDPTPDDTGNNEPATSEARLRDKWSLIVFDDGACADVCMKTLHETRQVREALGRDRDRIQRLLIISGKRPDAGFLETEHPRLIVLDTAGPTGEALADAARIEKNEVAGTVFLVDPLGNLIMRFPAGTGMKGIHKDLKKLLKISRIG
jgi:hypothetical protein